MNSSTSQKDKTPQKAMAVIHGASLAQLMGDESVIINVGPERKRYLLHKTLLTKSSEYFDRALNGSFKEADEQEMTFEEESPAAFELLIGWLYQDRIPVVTPSSNFFQKNVGGKSSVSPAKPLFGSQDRASAPAPAPALAPAPSSLFGGFGGLPSTSSLFQGHTPPTTQVEMGSFNILPSNDGTGRVPYQHTMETPQGQTIHPLFQAGQFPPERYENISFQQEYRHWSPEELRLADYSVRRYGALGIKRPNLFCDPALADQLNPTPFEGSQTSFPMVGRIPGIPQCSSLQDITSKEDQHQLAVLQLCLFAETLCWNTLFNRAMTAYVQGESNLSHRPIRSDHVALIYQRTHDDSPCRAFAADAAVSQLRKPEAQEQYMELTKEYPAFLRDIFKSLGTNTALSVRDPMKSPHCWYHVHASNQGCISLSDVEGATMFGQPGKKWMGWRSERDAFKAFDGQDSSDED